MRNHRAAYALTATVLAGFAGTAAAADSQNLNVTANVLAVCKFQGTAKTVNFADLDPSAGGNRTGTLASDVAYKCTNGTSVSTITVGQGANWDGATRRLRKGTTGTDYIKYALSVTAPNAGNGFGAASSDKVMTVTATIVSADYQDAVAGNYSDVVQLDVSP